MDIYNDELFNPDYENFENELYEKNPELTADTLDFFEKKKRGIYYYKMDLLKHADIPDLETVGYTYLLKRKVFKKDKISVLYSSKGRKSNVYNALNGVAAGFIPTENGHCIIYVRPKLTIYNILFPICIIRMIVLIFFKV